MKRLRMFPVAIALMAMALVGCDEVDSGSSASPELTATPTLAPTSATTHSPQPTATPPVKESPASPAATTPPNSLKAATIETLSCEITMARVNDPDGPLNVRSQPDTTANNVVGTLENGTMVTVASEQNGWLQITNPVAGWISQSRTESSCSQKVARVNFTPGSVAFKLSDRILGSGSHRYSFAATSGQTLTITAHEGPLPIVLAPNGGELNADSTLNGASTWTGSLNASGEYILDYPSNFRGFTYETSVELK
ncbi:MAG TPA: SH3 domain-containing protein [Oscillatoriales cyanobacterium M59_W2019_021]|nr:SH3 domain-containing protein [Oscillatoriales cyanobacterium M4454_W2019_049]HIK51173.1 SH3 domain-containing protein [Oscillatoriales cyanobacterium M59_W2019_021]